MRITHNLGNISVSKDSNDAAGFMLTNKIGGYLFFSEYPVSKYNGFFCRLDSQVFKIVDDIKAKNNTVLNEVINNFHNVETKRQNANESFTLPHGFNTMIYEVGKSSEIEVTLDCKKIYDNREFGRFYSISHEQGRIIVEFNKKNDDKDGAANKSKDNGEYKLYVVIDCDNPHRDKETSWQHWFYHMDFERRSPPYERFVFSIKPLQTKMVVITAGLDKQKAIDENIHVCQNIDALKERQRRYALSFLKDPLLKELSDRNKKMAYICSRYSTDSLVVVDNSKSQAADYGHINFHHGNIYAGLPWFCQFWSRDSLISCSSISDIHFVKELLISYVNSIADDGRLPNRMPATDLGCADGIGWLFLRIRELKAKNMFNEKELAIIRKKLGQSIALLFDKHSDNGFITNEKQETWMDTVHEDDGRPGKRIEIQALTLNMLRFYAELTKDTRARVMEKEFQLDVKESFFGKQGLVDGIYVTKPETKGNKESKESKDIKKASTNETESAKKEKGNDKAIMEGKAGKEKAGDEKAGQSIRQDLADETVRPNAFLAYYAYPKLLAKQEWEQSFDLCLKELWLNWGGLASISKNSPMFQPLYTGENAYSYHRGDSWYWINNLAALAMADIDIIKYKRQVEQIRDASINDLLWNGIIGHSSELSSALQQKAEGCLNQAWSSSTLVELISKTRALKSSSMPVSIGSIAAAGSKIPSLLGIRPKMSKM